MTPTLDIVILNDHASLTGGSAAVAGRSRMARVIATISSAAR